MIKDRNKLPIYQLFLNRFSEHTEPSDSQSYPTHHKTKTPYQGPSLQILKRQPQRAPYAD